MTTESTIYTAASFLSDIPLGVAIAAHEGTSHVPESRGAYERNAYAEQVAAIYVDILAMAGKERHDEALADLERFRDGYRDRKLMSLRRRGRVMSTMITGPANFPTRSQEKKRDSYENSVGELLDYVTRVYRKMQAKYSSSGESIRTGSANAVAQLEEKIAKLEANQEFMKAANKVIKDKKLDQNGKVEALLSLDDNLTEATAVKILTVPDCFNIVGFAKFELTNNSANIRRLKEQLEKAKRLAEQVTTEKMIGAVRVVNNCEDDRLELYFPTRTSKEIYAELKAHGFRYTPSKSVAPSGCFQAFRGPNAEYWAGAIASKYNAEVAAVQP
jgi:hypothetical protein